MNKEWEKDIPDLVYDTIVYGKEHKVVSEDVWKNFIAKEIKKAESRGREEMLDDVKLFLLDKNDTEMLPALRALDKLEALSKPLEDK